MASNGIRAWAVSYDSVEVLREFADDNGISYPLLADVDSAVIRQFGIFNTNVTQDHLWYGVPFPGTFMIDEDGRVFGKSFYADHAVRDSIATMLRDSFGVRG